MPLFTVPLRSWLVVCFVLFSSGCASNAERITDIQPNAIKPNSNVGVVWISPCNDYSGCADSSDASSLAAFVPDGATGLLTYGAVMSAHSDVIEALDQVSADALVEEKFLNRVASALEAGGAIPKINTSFQYAGNLTKDGRHSVMRLKSTIEELYPESEDVYLALGIEQNYDLSQIANELDSPTLVVLDLQYFGVRRSFGPLGIPLGRPYGLSVVRAYVWDVATKTVLYNDYGVARESIGGNWREPDEWTKVFTATNTALEIALERAATPLIDALK